MLKNEFVKIITDKENMIKSLHVKLIWILDAFKLLGGQNCKNVYVSRLHLIENHRSFFFKQKRLTDVNEPAKYDGLRIFLFRSTLNFHTNNLYPRYIICTYRISSIMHTKSHWVKIVWKTCSIHSTQTKSPLHPTCSYSAHHHLSSFNLHIHKGSFNTWAHNITHKGGNPLPSLTLYHTFYSPLSWMLV